MIFIVYPIFPYNNVIYFKHKQVYELPKGEIELNNTINERIALIKNKINKNIINYKQLIEIFKS